MCCGTRAGGLPRADEMVANGHPRAWRGRTLGSVAHNWFSFLLSRCAFPSGFPPRIKSSNHPRLKFCQAVSPFPVFPISRSPGSLHALLKCTSHPAPSLHSPLDVVPHTIHHTEVSKLSEALKMISEFSRWCSGKESTCQCRRQKRSGFYLLA